MTLRRKLPLFIGKKDGTLCDVPVLLYRLLLLLLLTTRLVGTVSSF
jgi:hypothetical protein